MVVGTYFDKNRKSCFVDVIQATQVKCYVAVPVLTSSRSHMLVLSV